MNRKTILTVGVIIILALVGGVAYMLSRNTSTQGDMNGMNHDMQSHQSNQSESETYKQYAALKGEEYDRMFLAGMIAHHQGAVDMASLAVTQAKHFELKTMAQNIVNAQTSEIGEMTAWQQAWDYPSSSGDNMMDHSAMGMMHDMAAMTDELKKLTGDDFDKKFIELMIQHHQQAIDMARPGDANAQHQEVKTLAKAIVTDQTKEISQMKTWQKDWGYNN